MKRLAGAALVAALLLIAAKPVATESSIAIADGSVLSFGGAVTFDVTVEKLTGTEYPMVYIECSSDVLLYGQLDHPDAVFILGGGWSPWHDIIPTPDAACDAWLYAYGGKSHGRDVVRTLAGPFSFHAEG
jgi:hypothetical protein